MYTRIIGDVHGLKNDLTALLHNLPEDITSAIQVGDMGVGFGQSDYWNESLDSMLLAANARFIRGNHDNPAMCKTLSSFIPDGLVENDVMFIGGAWSIDCAWRTEGINWWADEELSYAEFEQVISTYSVAKPKVMVTHDCPYEISKELFIDTGRAFSTKHYATRTSMAFSAMLTLHKPELWVFGHWHTDVDKSINGTRYICLNELSYADINLDTLEVRFPEYLNLRGHM